MTAASDTDAPAARRRVFFALWPDDDARARMVRAARPAVRRSGGRPTQRENLHVTVAFLGGLEENELELARGVPPVEVGAFELTLDRLGFSTPSGILWLTCAQIPAALVRLEQELWRGLERHGFERERRAFRPHVTLARRARAVEETVSAVPWTVRALTLVESIPAGRGVRYAPLEQWPV